MRVAVTQTPTAPSPNAPGLSASPAPRRTSNTLLHQGFASYHATFWSALMRCCAWRRCAMSPRTAWSAASRSGNPSRTTVIEDTVSSVDFVACGWRLTTTERLAYSATPPRLRGAVDPAPPLGQRRAAHPAEVAALSDARATVGHPAGRGLFPRSLLDIDGAGNLGVAVCWRFRPARSASSCGYRWRRRRIFPPHGRDLMQSGYRWTDLFRVYALNLLLISVNLRWRTPVAATGAHRSQSPVRPHAQGCQPHAGAYGSLAVAAAHILLGQWLLGAGNVCRDERWLLRRSARSTRRSRPTPFAPH